MIETERVIDLYAQRSEERSGKLIKFFTGEHSVQFLIVPRVANGLFTNCNSLEMIFEKNLEYLYRQLSIAFCDDLPFLEPWIGTGAYATAFGSQYLWTDGAAPDTIHAFNSFDQILFPDWPESPVLQMILDAIDMLKEKTRGMIPISLTDTQSPQDTATLILDTTEFITGMYTEPGNVHALLEKITQLTIDFTHTQITHIGESLLASPGHGFVGYPFLKGIGVSDDNMVISSPDFNEQFSFPYMNRLSKEIGGLALHSCGNWVRSMSKLPTLENLTMIDFAIAGNDTDPNPIPAAEAVEALRNYHGILKVRPGSDVTLALNDLKILSSLGNKMIIDFPCKEARYLDYYHTLEECLGSWLG